MMFKLSWARKGKENIIVIGCHYTKYFMYNQTNENNLWYPHTNYKRNIADNITIRDKGLTF